MPESTDAHRELAKVLDVLFSGVDAGLQSLREVRSIYDAEVAFDFNPLRLFHINENTVSAMLAYFLDPAGKHGQKGAFLRTFLELIGAKGALELVEGGAGVEVVSQHPTAAGRPIDIVIRFGNDQFLVGIENKVWGAVDQPEQLHDYIADIDTKSNGRFLMLYMSPDGTGPSTDSISASKLGEVGSRFQIIPFNRDSGLAVVPILKAWEGVCRADSVRAFLRFMAKYLREHFMGDKTMDEAAFLIDYLVKHPAAAAKAPALSSAYSSLKMGIESARNAVLRTKLKELDRRIEVDPQWPDHKYTSLKYPVTCLPKDICIEIEANVIGVPINKDPSKSNSLYVNGRQCDMGPFVSAMKAVYQRTSTNDCWLGGYVALPDLTLSDDDVAKVLAERNSTNEASATLAESVRPVVEFVRKYVDTVETEWGKANLPCAAPTTAELLNRPDTVASL